MKHIIDALIVVEGVTDIQFLSTFIDADFVITNGSAINQSAIDLIKAAKSKNKEVIVLTDPDFPGEKIRDFLARTIPGLSHAFVPKMSAISKGKVGVAQATEAVILQALKDKIVFQKTSHHDLTPALIAKLGFVGLPHSKTLRKQLIEHFHLGECNVKTMVKRLNFLGIRYDDITNFLLTK